MTFSKLTVLLGRAGLSIITFCATLTLAVAWMVTEFPHALDGTDVIESGKTPNYFRNAFEILSFSSGPALLMARAVQRSIPLTEEVESARQHVR